MVSLIDKATPLGGGLVFFGYRTGKKQLYQPPFR